MRSSSSDSNHSSRSSQESIRNRDSSLDEKDKFSHSKQKRTERKRSQKMRSRQEKHERRSRSRQKQQKRQRQKDFDKQDLQDKGGQNSKNNDHFDLPLYGNSVCKLEHLYFLQDENSKVSIETGIWSAVLCYGLRPKKVLIICESEKKMIRLAKASNINREMIIIDQDSKKDIKQLTKTYDIVLMTQQKSSITLGLDEGDIEIFDLVVNYGKTYSIEFYSLLPQFLGQNGIIFSVFQDKKQLERHQRKLKITFKELAGQINPNDIQNQIFNEIQFSKKLTNLNHDDLTLLKTLPYSLEETALKLFAMVKQIYQPRKSVYLNRQGHVTFSLKTDTEFNSIKYIWNFIREELPPKVVNNIKDMKKFENQRGVLFNVPISDLSKWQTFQSKIHKNDKKYKGYKLFEFINQELPKLQDTESQEYKLLQQKKEQALKNRHQLELFIAGIPYESNQVDIRRYFSEKQVNLFMIRILRDSSGFSKGIAFGLAQNQAHFQRALKLNGEKFGQRQLRIKLADQREK